MPLVRCRACCLRSRVNRRLLGSTMCCPRCGSRSVDRLSLFHSTHPAGLWAGHVILALAGASAIWIAWSVWRTGKVEATPEVVPLAYASCVALLTGTALVWRYNHAM